MSAPSTSGFGHQTSAGALVQKPPLLRGALHLVGALLAPFGLLLLLDIADSPAEYVGAAIFSATLMALYTTSASYHLLPWRPRARAVVQRADHSMIFALIAGTYTPFCLIVLNLSWGVTMLALVWTLAGFGILFKIAWPSGPRWLGVLLYMGIGWVGVIPIAEVVPEFGAWPLATLLLGGLLYSLGAVVYALRWPDPSPRVFGYHEVFHCFVIAGSVTHFILIAVAVL